MALTGAQLLTGFSKFINDWESSTTTSAGASDGSTLVDTYLRRYGDGRLDGRFLRPTGAANQYAIRRIHDFANATGTCTVQPVFAAQAATTQAYELHKYDPALKFRALDAARFDVADDVFQLIYNDTITSDGRTLEYDIPSGVRRGPGLIFVESPLSPDAEWNFLSDPEGDSTANWTAASLTPSTVDRDDNDLIVPKYDETCTKLVVAGSTNGTYKQVVGSMANDITAAGAAGRLMTWAAWVYCNEASRVTLTLEDDNAETSSTAHSGNGWELLTMEKTIVGNNATTLTAGFDVSNSANPVTAYFNRGWLYYGGAERVTDIYPDSLARTIRRDAVTQKFTLQSLVPRGHQLRLVGKDVLSALGDTAASQVTNTMEVDEESAEILYARAAEILFQWERITADDEPAVFQRIAYTRERLPQLRKNWSFKMPSQRMVGPYSL